MKILSIETSCDESAISIVECFGELLNPSFNVLATSLISQINLHKEYGGVFPTLAKREHAINLPIILRKVLEDSRQFKNSNNNFFIEKKNSIDKILSKEKGLFDSFVNNFSATDKPDVDYIAVTVGPGLAPALWVGISFASALSLLWKIPMIPVNHMEGHIASVLTDKNSLAIDFPAVSLLISGGHTELVKIDNWGKYQIIGSTLDDAVGEAFDKSARMMGLPYPGGPEVSRLATHARIEKIPKVAHLPRPMLYSHDLNFSFAGLKTAVLYYIRDNFSGDNSRMSENDKADLSREIEDAVIDVLLAKTTAALDLTGAKTLIVAGGVISNTTIKQSFINLKSKYTYLDLRLPEKEMSTDNSVMIAFAGYLTILTKGDSFSQESFIANGNLKLQ